MDTIITVSPTTLILGATDTFGLKAELLSLAPSGSKGLFTAQDGTKVYIAARPTLKLLGQSQGLFWYGKKSGTAVLPGEIVPPPVVAPPPPPIATGGIVTLQNDAITAVINEAGAHGNLHSDNYVGLKVNGTELVLVGYQVEGALIGYKIDGVASTARQRVIIDYTAGSNTASMRGTNNGPVWTGDDGKIGVRQRVELLADRLRYSIMLANISDKPMTDVRYRRVIDANPSDSAMNTLAVTSAYALSTWALGKAVRYTSPDPRASFFIADRLDPRDAFLPFNTLKSGKLDFAIGVQILVGNLGAGESTTFQFDLSVG